MIKFFDWWDNRSFQFQLFVTTVFLAVNQIGSKVLFDISTFNMILLILLEVFVIFWTGSKHAYLYSKIVEDTKIPNKRREWVGNHLEIHKTQMYGEWLFFVLLWLLGVPALVIFGTQLVARIPFQGFINWAIGYPFIDKNESSSWVLQTTEGKLTRWKFLPGKKSYLKLALGAALIVAGVLI